MRIAESRVDLASHHQRTVIQRSENREFRELREFRPATGPTGPTRPALGLFQDSAPVSLSSRTKDSAGAELNSARAKSVDGEETIPGDPTINLLRHMLRDLFGLEVKTFDAKELNIDTEWHRELTVLQESRQIAAEGGSALAARSFRQETEQLSFAAEGVVRTTDGEEIRFALRFELQYQRTEELRVVAAENSRPRKDPLVLNFDGPAAQLADQTFHIDLDGDGSDDAPHLVGAGSGFLVFDRNGNGKLDGRHELFGPQTGDGFRELAQHDEDGNGWIDEGDAIWKALRLWSEGGLRWQHLDEAGVGAIGLGRVATPFELRLGNGDSGGQIGQTGLFLRNDGRAGTIQHLDLAI